MTAFPAEVPVHHGQAHSVRLRIPAKPEYITLGRLALSGIARSRTVELAPELLADLKLALTEACTNSVRHAYGDDAGMVDILYELHEDRIVIEVTDEGEGFDASTQPPPFDTDELNEGGLGIAIIQALTDAFEIRDGARGGSTLRFVKQFA
jgi:serine/threonine-protein kinase RsbW